ncbi:MAG: hypothetical protein EHM55_19295, partial [Acidobacteria bacterium]
MHWHRQRGARDRKKDRGSGGEHGGRSRRARGSSARRACRRSAGHQQSCDGSRHKGLAPERGSRGRAGGRRHVDLEPLNFAFSSCPNDTFAFHALVHGLVHGPRVIPHIDDVEALNARAERGEAEVTKVSIAAYDRIRDRYALLRAGGAAGFGVGPIVVARTPRAVGGRVAIPGERTTAALLLHLLGSFERVPMRFDQIENAVMRGEVDCGVLIHEGRFTYHAKGLVLLADLGAAWEERMQCPLPLAAIAIRRDLVSSCGRAMDDALRSSVEHAFAH